MKMQIVKIGNSKGIRIPSVMLKQCGIEKDVEVEVVDGAIVIKASMGDDINLKFHNVEEMTDYDIQLMLRATDMNSLAASLAGANDKCKERVFKNMSKRAYEEVIQLIEHFEKLKPMELLSEISKTTHKVEDMTDYDIQLMLRDTDMNSLAASLAGENDKYKEIVFKNMSKRACEEVKQLIEELRKNNSL
ncbi:AbrB/MazE/SpoVT family DNA-binding domain-containing protein [Oceanirhabdus sp. W0125-5]|uniref:AbrB/MazE/SpoVT family DNA-binding domain-containing protein n=1 Tax=Oceanirhabdus sp. W0125-5 TaxID=2999116 RepID=UPI0022F2D54E|nr:FliG C-terminal domain-containing protein [Oceanirhabdus sp. W0125-5]WBW97883.1 FliG C-terminal domain-containing protein [Oceanirhabdus sp. W0125-5]